MPVACITRHDFYIPLVRDQWVLISREMTFITKGTESQDQGFLFQLFMELCFDTSSLSFFLQLEFFTAIQFFYLFLWLMLEPTEKLQVSVITGGASSLIFYFADGQEHFFRLWVQREDFNLGDTTRWRISGHERRSFSNKSVPTLFKCFNYFIYKPYCLVFFDSYWKVFILCIIFSVGWFQERLFKLSSAVFSQHNCSRGLEVCVLSLIISSFVNKTLLLLFTYSVQNRLQLRIFCWYDDDQQTFFAINCQLPLVF